MKLKFEEVFGMKFWDFLKKFDEQIDKILVKYLAEEKLIFFRKKLRIIERI